MTDPCGNEPGFERVVACFMEKLILDDNSCSTTIRGHVDMINKLFQLRNFKPPADLSDRTNMCARILFAREKEEDIARQRSPISKEMFASLIEVAKHSPPNSLEVNVADWMIFVRITGLRCAEYAHKYQSGVDENIYPSGKRVVKAFHPTDWEFYDNTGATGGGGGKLGRRRWLGTGRPCGGCPPVTFRRGGSLLPPLVDCRVPVDRWQLKPFPVTFGTGSFSYRLQKLPVFPSPHLLAIRREFYGK